MNTNPLPAMGSWWTNNKNGNDYKVLYMAIDQTNASAGQHVVVYKQQFLAPVYVRTLTEFRQKFSKSRKPHEA